MSALVSFTQERWSCPCERSLLEYLAGADLSVFNSKQTHCLLALSIHRTSGPVPRSLSGRDASNPRLSPNTLTASSIRRGVAPSKSSSLERRAFNSRLYVLGDDIPTIR